MHRISRHVATLASTAVVLIANPATSFGEPIRIVVGEDVIFGGGISGNPAGGVDSARADAQACHPCEPGQTTSFSGSLRGTFFGTFENDGTVFELGGFNNAFLDLTVDAPSFRLRPPRTFGTWTVRTPFAYSASLAFDNLTGEDTFEHMEFFFGGSGVATGEFNVAPFPESSSGIQINFAGATFDVGAASPTPEPSSLMLLGAALATGVIRSLRGRATGS